MLQKSLKSPVFGKTLILKILVLCIWISEVLDQSNVETVRCRPNDLLPGVKVTGPCTFRPDSICDVQCEQHGAALWNTQVVCHRNGSWSHTPHCEGVTVKKHLESVDCGTLPLSKKQKKPLLCLKIVQNVTRKVSCPRLLELKVELRNCSREPNSECRVSCGGDTSTLRCLPDGTWSHVPKCVPLERGLCRPAEPETAGGSLVNCSGRVGESCKFRCLDGEIARETVVCLPSGVWCAESAGTRCPKNATRSTFPNCAATKPCSGPQIPRQLVVSGNCSLRRVGDRCAVSCRHGGKVIGDDSVLCLNETRWTKAPACTCPRPVLRGELKSLTRCDSVLPGERCYLTCSGGGSTTTRIAGRNFITCGKESRWEERQLPICEPKTCPKPILSPTLKFVGECQRKKPGEACEVACSEGGDIVGLKASVTCLETLGWTDPPECTCPVPDTTNSDLVTVGSCRGIPAGGKCPLRCRNETSTVSFPSITCRNDTRWSALPRCVSNFCREPELSPGLIVEGSCSSKLPGEKCSVSCSGGGKVLGEPFVRCVAAPDKWTAEPDCACPPPITDEDLESTEDCSRKRRGHRCNLRCGGGKTLVGKSYIVCRRNLRWSSQPMCRIRLCGRPPLPAGVLEPAEGDCSSKTIGETCELRCTTGGKVIGSPTITCVNSTAWSGVPDCTCPPPLLEEGLESTTDCTEKRTGDKCQLRCKDDKKLVGDVSITCQSNLRWSSQPTCRIRICAKPWFPDGLLEPKEGDCSAKTVGETCELRCAAGGKVVGPDTIRCLNESHWSGLPECTCPEPVLPLYLRLEERDCSGKVKFQTCKVGCIPGFGKLLGDDSITCDEKMKWNRFPRCENPFCPKPVLPKGVLRSTRDCSLMVANEKCELTCEQGGKIAGGSGGDFITCLDGTRWSELPDCTCPVPVLNEGLVSSEDCTSKRRGQECGLLCEGKGKKMSGNGSIICQENTRWSPQPTCEEQFCPRPDLPSYLTISGGDCSSVLVGRTCELKCTEGGRIVGGRSSIECLENLSWTSLPTCTCPPLASTGELKAENCTSVMPGEGCRVSCADRLSSPSKDIVRCNSDGRWDETPVCRKSGCQEVKFVSPSMYRGTCANMSVGDICYLRCSGSGKFVENINYIRCTQQGKWTRPRKCVCPPHRDAELADYNVLEDCSSKGANETCRVSCKSGFDLGDKSFIKCSTTYQWIDLPKCEEDSCPSPNLSPFLKPVDGNCEQLKVGHSCKVDCEKGMLNGPDTIQCHENKTLSAAPTCDCAKPDIPSHLEVSKSDCSSVPVGQVCELKCAEGGKIVGATSAIVCLDNLNWTSPPVCTCPPLNSTKDLQAVNCSSVAPGEKCAVFCTDKLSSPEKDSVECNSNGKWDRIPVCKKSRCPDIKFAPPSTYQGDCINKSFGAMCDISCSGFGKFVEDKNFIRCMEGGSWSKPRKCVCAIPREAQVAAYNILEDCSKKGANENCRVSCKSGLDLANQNFLRCSASYQWMNFPRCELDNCPPPDLSPFLKLTEGDCQNLKVGQSCRLACEKGVLNGSDTIQCFKNKTLSAAPTCDCAKPDIPPYLKISQSDCSSIPVNHVCELNCIQGGKIVGNGNTIKCLDNLNWTPPPKCTCSPMNSTKELKVENCSSVAPGEKCKVSCTDKFSSPDKDFVMCDSDSKWAKIPVCKKSRCPNIRFAPPSPYRGACVNKSVGEMCNITCSGSGKFVEDKNSIRCMEGGGWLRPRKCVCPRPPAAQMAAYNILEDCSKKGAKENCRVSCKSGLNLGDKNFITCSASYQWMNFPRCEEDSCPPPPNLSPFLKHTERDCQRLKVGESCKLTCEKGVLNGSNTIQCFKNKTLSATPTCDCAKPDIPSYLKVSQGDCSSAPANQVCALSCAQGGKIIGAGNSIKCLENLNWSPFPKCSCPPLSSTKELKTDNCSSVTPGERCRVSCTDAFSSPNKDFVLCKSEAKWDNLPTCRKSRCPDVRFAPPSNYRGACVNKSVGATCDISCSGFGNFVEGKNSIRCMENGGWSQPGKCVCPSPREAQVAAYNILEDCSGKGANENCRVSCKNGLNLGNRNFIRCSASYQWMNFPRCEEDNCPPPNLSPFLKPTEGDCRSLKVGQSCRLVCEKGVLNGSDTMQCFRNKTLSGAPTCDCAKPDIPPYLNVSSGDCSSVAVGQVCELKCSRSGGRLVGDSNVVECLTSLSWSPPPVCTCPPLNSTKQLRTDNCNAVKPGDRCRVSCTDKLSSPNRDFVACGPDGEWTDFPICKKSRCPDLKLTTPSPYRATCVNVPLGGSCNVSCGGFGVFFSAAGSQNSVLRCAANGQWTRPGRCVCQPPRQAELPDLNILENCRNKGAEQKCRVSCKSGVDLGARNFIRCSASFQWVDLPRCVEDRCSSINLPRFVKPIEGDCFRLKFGQSCRVACEQGVLHGHDTIFCFPNKTLSAAPSCVCAKPHFPSDTMPTQGDCGGKLLGEFCYYACKVQPEATKHVECIEWWGNITFTGFVDCPCDFPMTLNNYARFGGDCEKKMIFNVNETCAVRCENGGAVFGPPTMTCTPRNQWTPSPECTCAPPPPPRTIRPTVDLSRCTAVLPGQRCPVSCFGGAEIDKSTYKCNDDYNWDAYPVCTNYCASPLLAPGAWGVRLLYECENATRLREGASCTVDCEGRDMERVANVHFVTCRSDGTWNKAPQCSCPRVRVPHPYKLFENVNCDGRFQNETCPLSLEPGFHFAVPTHTFVTCRNGEWSQPPAFKANDLRPRCVQPFEFDPLWAVPPECNVMVPGQRCAVECKNKVPFLDQEYTYSFDVTCRENPAFPTGAAWDFMPPKCTCIPTVAIPRGVVYPFPHRNKAFNTYMPVVCTKIKKTTYVRCLDNGYWELPECPDKGR